MQTLYAGNLEPMMQGLSWLRFILDIQVLAGNASTNSTKYQ
jgi:hypothetical protein